MFPNNDIVSALIALQMSGGGAYTNEPKTLTANGEYTPPDDVRWDKVAVDVPAAQNYGEIFSKMPTYCGWAFCGGKWVVLFKMADGFETDIDGTSIFGYHTYESDGAIYSDLDSERKTHYGYLCLYKNGNKFICTDRIFGREEYYRYGGTDSGVTPYKTYELSNKCGGVEKPTYSISRGSFLSYVTIEGTAHFKQHVIERDYYTGKVTRDEVEDITLSLGYGININGSGFSDLSLYDRYDAYIEFGKDITEWYS